MWAHMLHCWYGREYQRDVSHISYVSKLADDYGMKVVHNHLVVVSNEG